MNNYKPGDQVYAGATLATFIRNDGPNRAIIAVGMDTRVVDPVALRKVTP